MVFLSEQAQDDIKKEIGLTVPAAITQLTNDLQPIYLKKFQVCALLNVSNNTIDDFIKMGLPRTVITDGVIRYNRDEVIAWAKQYRTSY